MTENKECLGFWKEKVKIQETEIDKYYQLEEEDVFPCVPVSVVKKAIKNVLLLERIEAQRNLQVNYCEAFIAGLSCMAKKIEKELDLNKSEDVFVKSPKGSD